MSVVGVGAGGTGKKAGGWDQKGLVNGLQTLDC